MSEQAADNIPAIQNFNDTITSIFYFFHKSPTKCDQLESIQKMLDDPAVKYKEVHAVRWLSFFTALEKVYRTLDSLITFCDARSHANDPKATGMKKEVAQELVIKLSCAMMDWLQPVMRLSRFFQRKDTDIGVVKVNVMMCISDLEKMRVDLVAKGKPTYFSELKDDLKDGFLKTHRVAQNASHFQGVKTQCMQAMTDNMHARFPDLETMFQLSVLGMPPLQFLSDSDTMFQLSVLGMPPLQFLSDSDTMFQLSVLGMPPLQFLSDSDTMFQLSVLGMPPLQFLSDSDTMFQLSVLGMPPLQFLSDNHLEAWGNAEIESVAEFYTSSQHHVSTGGELCQSDPFLQCTTAQVMEEWKRCKKLVKSNMYPHTLSLQFVGNSCKSGATGRSTVPSSHAACLTGPHSPYPYL